jgi:dipeptidase
MKLRVLQRRELFGQAIVRKRRIHMPTVKFADTDGAWVMKPAKACLD